MCPRCVCVCVSPPPPHLLQCCRFDCAAEELLGLALTEVGGATGDCRLAGYSAHTLHMWSINQVHTLHTTLARLPLFLYAPITPHWKVL